MRSSRSIFVAIVLWRIKPCIHYAYYRNVAILQTGFDRTTGGLYPVMRRGRKPRAPLDSLPFHVGRRDIARQWTRFRRVASTIATSISTRTDKHFDSANQQYSDRAWAAPHANFGLAARKL
jgi:hypothetical protein